MAQWPYGGSWGLWAIASELFFYEGKAGQAEVVAMSFGNRHGLCLGKETRLVTILFIDMHIPYEP